MLWLDVVEITDGTPSCFMHALFMGAPPIDGFKVIELSVVNKSKSVILECCAARDKVRDDVSRFDDCFGRQRKAHWSMV